MKRILWIAACAVICFCAVSQTASAKPLPKTIRYDIEERQTIGQDRQFEIVFDPRLNLQPDTSEATLLKLTGLGLPFTATDGRFMLTYPADAVSVCDVLGDADRVVHVILANYTQKSTIQLAEAAVNDGKFTYIVVNCEDYVAQKGQ
jgi:hypothetical protein